MNMKEQVISKFEYTLNTFLDELHTTNSYLTLYENLNTKRNDSDSLKALNKAPAFFSLSMHSYQHMLIMGISKICEKRNSSGENIFSFLKFIENNYQLIFPNPPLKPHHKIINKEVVDEHLAKLATFDTCMSNLISWRDKSFAHADKKYFGEKKLKLSTDFPINVDELKSLINLLADILNTYNTSYSDKVTGINSANINDVDKVITALINENNRINTLIQGHTKHS